MTLQLAKGDIMAETTYKDDLARRSEESADATSTLNNKVSDTVGKAKEKAEEYGKAVQNKIDETRAPAADSLQSAASKLHETAEGLPGGEKVTSLAHATADKIQATAEYVRDHDVKAMMTDVEHVVRRHPGQSLLIAAAVGFLLGRAFKSED
jgi:ElaB/YqjD/DUF883 family membrane-anchored ribosome-binding protein